MTNKERDKLKVKKEPAVIEDEPLKDLGKLNLNQIMAGLLPSYFF